jgi:energy-coupling factor transporter ATP-binding protein EcfA2
MLLSGRNGLFLHSCAVSLEESGILFSGVSGSGKSTMAELWRRFGPPASNVIDDEHILARQAAGATLLYGAPWARGPRAASFSRTPLRSIFFLSHGKQNACKRMTAGEALAQLLSQVFLPLWSREQIELTIQTCTNLLQDIACYDLRFVPGPEVIDFVQDLLRDSL